MQIVNPVQYAVESRSTELRFCFNTVGHLFSKAGLKTKL